MRVFRNEAWTTVELRSWSREKPGIVLVRLKSSIPFFPIKECGVNWKHIFRSDFTFILLPWMRFYRGYCDIEIGLPRMYIQIIRTHK